MQSKSGATNPLGGLPPCVRSQRCGDKSYQKEAAKHNLGTGLVSSFMLVSQVRTQCQQGSISVSHLCWHWLDLACETKLLVCFRGVRHGMSWCTRFWNPLDFRFQIGFLDFNMDFWISLEFYYLLLWRYSSWTINEPHSSQPRCIQNIMSQPLHHYAVHTMCILTIWHTITSPRKNDLCTRPKIGWVQRSLCV